MGFFNEIGKKTTEATSKITKETKLKLKMNENKGKISDLYEEIGKKVYEKHIREEDINIKEELKEECEKIDELSRQIEEARQEILKLNNKRQCFKCYTEIEKDSIFCPKCGTKQVEEKEDEVIENEEIEVVEKDEIQADKNSEE